MTTLLTQRQSRGGLSDADATQLCPTDDLYVRRKRRLDEIDHSIYPHKPAEEERQRAKLYTDPYPANTDRDVFQYVFGANCALDFFGSQFVDVKTILKTMQSGISWDEARFMIERKHGAFSVAQKKANLIGSYIHGYFWTQGTTNWRKDAKPIPRDHVMLYTDRVIVIRKPLRQTMAAYVPERFRAEMKVQENELQTEEERQREERINKFFEQMKSHMNFKEDMTEEEKIELLIEKTKDQDSINALRERILNKNKRSYQAQFHPSDIEADPSLVKPPPDNYVCHRCMKRGHWKHMCPTRHDISFTPVSQPKVPSGIPKTMLREARTDDERKQAMLTDDGRLVVMKY
jgi:hypothetical protein